MKGRFAQEPSYIRSRRKWLITLEVEEEPTEYDTLKDKDLRIDIKKWSEKRSLDANGYCWVLCTKIAEKLKSSKDEVYEEMIQRYAPFDKRDDGGYISVTMLSIIPIETLGGHWKSLGATGKFTSYMKLMGSSEMNTIQMAHFLDGVVSEAKELDIPTETPDEIERLKSLWNQS